MNESDALQNMLEDLAGVYGADVNVLFHDQPHADTDGEYVAVNPEPSEFYDTEFDGPQELRVIRDDLSHEVEHIRSSDLWAKKGMIEDYGGKRSTEGRLAGNVYNALEDGYIDAERCSRYPGLRRTAAFVHTQIVGDLDVSEVPKDRALVGGLHQIALIGTAKGVRDADDDVRRFLAWALEHVEAYRREDDPERRAAICKRLVDALLEELPDEPDVDDLMDDMEEQSPASEDMGDESLDADDVSDMLEDVDLDDLDLPDEDDLENEGEDAEADASIEVEKGAEPGDGDESEQAEGEDAEADADVDYDDLTDEAQDTLDELEDLENEGEDPAGGEGGEDGDAQGDEDLDADGDADGEGAGEGDDAQGDESGEQADAQDGDETGGEGDSPGGRPEPTEGGPHSNEPGADGDPIEDTLETMDERDENGAEDWFGLDDDVDYEDAADSDERRYERVKRREQESNTPIGERLRERDETLENSRPRDSHDKVRDILRETGIAEDVATAFRKFKTQDITVAAEDGDELNIENIVAHKAGDYGETRVYEQTYRATTGGRVIGVSMDLSGSMVNKKGHLGSDRLRDAKAALGALHVATEQIGDDLVVNGYTTARRSYTNVETPLIVGPSESFEWEHLDACTTALSKYTATADGVADMRGLLEQAHGREKVMIVVSDGGANVELGGGEASYGDAALDDARERVEKARAEGIKVIGLGVGKGISDDDLAHMFGEDGYVRADDENMADRLVEVYKQQLDLSPAHDGAVMR